MRGVGESVQEQGQRAVGGTGSAAGELDPVGLDRRLGHAATLLRPLCHGQNRILVRGWASPRRVTSDIVAEAGYDTGFSVKCP
ncbi:hypothetical protein GCM10022221_51320 [Actinocorallia aurea]